MVVYAGSPLSIGTHGNEAAVPPVVLRWLGGCAVRHAGAGATSACYFNLSLCPARQGRRRPLESLA